MVNIDYQKLSSNIKSNSGLVKVLNILDKAITYITVICYAIILLYGVYLILEGNPNILYRSILIPGVSFMVVSVYRHLVSAPRPYEVYDFVPAVHKDTHGKSFPSRHVFSIFMVACTAGQISTAFAAALFIMGIVLSVIRVVGGVHFLRDVIAGAILGLLCGFIGYALLCGFFNIGMLVS